MLVLGDPVWFYRGAHDRVDAAGSYEQVIPDVDGAADAVQGDDGSSHGDLGDGAAVVQLGAGIGGKFRQDDVHQSGPLSTGVDCQLRQQIWLITALSNKNRIRGV
jgi:hypothetical protein